MKRLILAAALVLAGCGGTATAPTIEPSVAPSADPCAAAITAVQALASRLSVGMTHEQYTAALGDTAVVVDASGCTTLDATMTAYKAAADRWAGCLPTCYEANFARIQIDWDEAAAAMP